MQAWHKAQKKKEASKNRKNRQAQRLEFAKDEDAGKWRQKVSTLLCTLLAEIASAASPRPCQIRALLRVGGGIATKLSGPQQLALREARGRLCTVLRAQGVAVDPKDPDLVDAAVTAAKAPSASAAPTKLHTGMIPAALRRKRRREGSQTQQAPPKRSAPLASSGTEIVEESAKSGTGADSQSTVPPSSVAGTASVTAPTFSLFASPAAQAQAEPAKAAQDSTGVGTVYDDFMAELEALDGS